MVFIFGPSTRRLMCALPFSTAQILRRWTARPIPWLFPPASSFFGSIKKEIEIALSGEGKVTDLVTGKTLKRGNGRLTLSFYPCQLRAVHISGFALLPRKTRLME